MWYVLFDVSNFFQTGLSKSRKLYFVTYIVLSTTSSYLKSKKDMMKQELLFVIEETNTIFTMGVHRIFYYLKWLDMLNKEVFFYKR